MISVGDTIVKDASVPWKLTLVVPVKLVPRMVTEDPALPALCTVFTKGLSPSDIRYTGSGAAAGFRKTPTLHDVIIAALIGDYTHGELRGDTPSSPQR